MALSFLRRRAPESGEDDRKPSSEDLTRYPPQRSNSMFPSGAIVFLLFLAVWSATTLLSGTAFHICVSSRKLNVYCISGRTGREVGFQSTFNSSRTLGDELFHGDNQSSSIGRGDGNGGNHRNNYEEKAKGMKAVEEEMKLIRVMTSSGTAAATSRSCEGRGVYVYDLPAKFNYDLLSDCRRLLPWEDLCGYFSNEAMGDPMPSLGEGWYRTYQYSLEPIFHNRALTHPCRTHDPDEAAVFYVPFYGGLDVLKWNFGNVSNDRKDALGREVVAWLERQPSWVRNQGNDHVLVLGRASWDFRRKKDVDWGNNLLELSQLQTPYKLLVERQPWEAKDVGVPYPTHFHPHSDDDIDRWQTKAISTPRKHLIAYVEEAASTTRSDLKSELAKACKSSGDEICRYVDCNPDACSTPETVTELFTESEFCLHPPADDGPSRRSVFDSMVGGCIPVLFDPFTAYYQYPWHLPEDRRLYSVYVDGQDVTRKGVDVAEKLRGVAKEHRDDMRRYIVYRVMPGLVYGDATSELGRFRDAFGVAMDAVVEMVSRSRRIVES